MQDQEARPTARTRCTATAKDGSPCTAWATATGLCAGHSRMGLAADPRDAGLKGAETRRDNRAKRRVHAERRKMTLAEALAERAAEERDTIVEALFAPILSDDSTAMEKHRAAIGVLERMLGKPKEPVIVEEKAPVLTWDEEVALLMKQLGLQDSAADQRSIVAAESGAAPVEAAAAPVSESQEEEPEETIEVDA